MPYDPFEPREMLEVLRQIPPARTFLKETFFKKTETHITEHVDIDIVKGGRRMAPFVHPRLPGQVVERDGFRTETFTPPHIKPKTQTQAEDLLKRQAGESIFSGRSPSDRAAAVLADDLMTLDELITRREEWMCAQALFTGRVPVQGDGVDMVIDFGLSNVVTLSGANRWNQPTSSPMANLRGWHRQIVKGSGISPTICLMGTEVADVFLENQQILKYMDLRKVEMGQIDPQQLPGGVTYYGYLKEFGIDLYGYVEWYRDDAGAEQLMVPPKSVLLASPTARLTMHYGAIVDLEAGTVDLPRFPRSWTERDPSSRFVQVMSRPLPVPHQIDSILVAQVL